jgi:hypothetical protein
LQKCDDSSSARIPRPDPVLAVAEEDEVVLQQPLQECDRLVDLVVGVAPRARARDLHHAPAALGHLREVEHRAAHVVEHFPDGVGERLEPGVVEPAVEVEVHHRLARARLARVEHLDDATVRVALQADDGVQRPLHGQALGGDRLAHRIDEERQVLRGRLQHRTGALVALLGGRRVERTHEDRAVAAGGGEVEHAGDLGEQLVHDHRLRRVDRQAPQVGRRELLERPRVLRPPLCDQLHQPVADGRDRVLPRLR